MNTTLVRLAALILIVTPWYVSASLAQDSTESKPKSEKINEADLQSQMLGAWLLAGKPGTDDAPKRGARMKFFGHHHWLITQADPDTGKVIWHHGGTYELDGNTLVTKTLFAIERTAHLIGSENRFKVKVDGNTYTQIGVGNPWSEAWRRTTKKETQGRTKR